MCDLLICDLAMVCTFKYRLVVGGGERSVSKNVSKWLAIVDLLAENRVKSYLGAYSSADRASVFGTEGRGFESL